MRIASESSTMGDHLRLRVPRKADPIPNIQQSTTCKSTISSLLLSTFTNTNTNNPEPNIDTKRKGFGLIGFGCTAHPEVEVPGALIRASADWKDTGNRKNKNKKKKKKNKESSSVLEVQDVWCGPGIGFSTDDLVASTRPVSSRPKIHHHRIHQTQRPYAARQRVNLDNFPDLDQDSSMENPRFGSDVFEARYYHHLRNRSPEGLSEVMFQNRLFMGTRSHGFDRYRELRLDIENMSYEELVELGERIGYVSTGVKEDKIGECIRKAKISSSLPTEADRKCSICQEEYETDEEMGQLECRHVYHIQCIKQWLGQRNACPVCKAEASIC